MYQKRKPLKKLKRIANNKRSSVGCNKRGMNKIR